MTVERRQQLPQRLPTLMQRWVTALLPLQGAQQALRLNKARHTPQQQQQLHRLQIATAAPAVAATAAPATVDNLMRLILRAKVRHDLQRLLLPLPCVQRQNASAAGAGASSGGGRSRTQAMATAASASY